MLREPRYTRCEGRGARGLRASRQAAQGSRIAMTLTHDHCPEPLTWPRPFVTPTWSERFFDGFPFIGASDRAYRVLCQKLAERSETAVRKWRGTPEAEEVFSVVSRILCKWLKWPNARFIPEDQFSVLVRDWQHVPVSDCRTEAALGEIEHSLGLEIEIAQWNELLTKNLGAVVAWLVTERNRNSQDNRGLTRA